MLLALLLLLLSTTLPARASASFQLSQHHHHLLHHLSSPRAFARACWLLLSDLSFSDSLPRPCDRAFRSLTLINPTQGVYQDCASAGMARAKQTAAISCGGTAARKQLVRKAASMATFATGGNRDEMHSNRNDASAVAIKQSGRNYIAQRQDGRCRRRKSKKDVVDRFGAIPDAVAFARSNANIEITKEFAARWGAFG